MKRPYTKLRLKAVTKRIKELWEEGKIRVPVHLCGGNEDQLVEIFKYIEDEDYVFSTHRNYYHYLLKGGCEKKLIAEMRQQPEGVCRGRAGSMCITDRSINFFSTAIVGGNCAPAIGVAWAIKHSGKKQTVWCFVGDGAVDTGHFWEAYRYAVYHKLPIQFVVENNDRSTTSSVQDRWGITEEKLNKELSLMDLGKSRLIVYSYEPDWPHVGSGTYVAF